MASENLYEPHTFMMQDPRTSPRRAPVSVDTCDDPTVERWRADHLAFPPRLYKARSMVWYRGAYRLLIAADRVVRMGPWHCAVRVKPNLNVAGARYLATAVTVLQERGR